ncbi:MAG: hypothetical protein LQ340_004550 [Diploschistes diacapsis]|nr:MAG: hypothetical protein LQ340_004550 [Diploschistes diacapsis]
MISWDTFQEMINSIKAPYSECVKLLLDNIELDPHFKQFYRWARENGIPVIVLSSGMTVIIRPLLEKLVGSEANDIDIICNEMVDRPGMNREQPGGWNIQYHDDSGFGHDKSLTIRPYAEHFEKHPNEPRPTMLYAGDGVSDLSAARETDLLFAKKGRGEVIWNPRIGWR